MQVECRNRHGRMRRGRKVTGLQFMPAGEHLLVTTNDSRTRLINTDDFSSTCKFKGVVNTRMQIRSTFRLAVRCACPRASAGADGRCFSRAARMASA